MEKTLQNVLALFERARLSDETRSALRNPFNDIHQLRQSLFKKDYNGQNHILARHMEVKVCPRGVRRITYKKPLLEKFPEVLFKNVMELPKRNSLFLSRKWTLMVSLFNPMRGMHEHRMTKLLPEAQNRVIDYTSSYKATESHYRQAKPTKSTL